MKVTLELSEKQAGIVEEALEFYSRIHMGQFEELGNFFHKRNYNRDEFRHLTDQLRRCVFPELQRNAYYGICDKKHLSDNARIAWDIQQVIRHGVSWKRYPNGGITVNFDPPMRTSESEGLPKVVVEG